MIQSFIRTEFKDVTIITAAHRLQTIKDYDKIVSSTLQNRALLFIPEQLVLDEGCLVEQGTPKELLSRSQGLFKALVDGSLDKENLYAMAGL